MFQFWRLPLAFLPLLAPVLCAPTQNSLSTPAINQDFADPAVINAQNAWYAFATGNGKVHVQVARSADFNSWNVLGQDALPGLPAWVNQANPEIWAPHVTARDDGVYVLYFSAALAAYPAHCVGVATSNASVTGPYTPHDMPLVCPDPTGQNTDIPSIINSPPGNAGGAIDASGFRDADGTHYLLYKVDGNSLGNGGVCGNTIAPIHSTPIMLVPLGPDAIQPAGNPVQILDRSDTDGPLVEAPSLSRATDGKSYTLFFSSGCYSDPSYDVSWAFAPSIWGPYTKSGPLLTTGAQGLQSPGGATVALDGVHAVFHATTSNGRLMYTMAISGGGTQVRYS